MYEKVDELIRRGCRRTGVENEVVQRRVYSGTGFPEETG